MVTELVCVSCGERVAAAPRHAMTCTTCGPDRGTLDYAYDLAALRRRWARPDAPGGLATWLPLLPLRDGGSLPRLAVGPTPLVDAPRLANHLGVGRILLKLDSFLPSLSLKDRASALAVAQAGEWGCPTIVAASTGNAASSLATLAAASGCRAVLLVPQDAPMGKLAQIALHGGILIPIQGTYDQAFDLSTEVAARQGWYIRSTAVNPVLAEGKKTAALETALQMSWDVDDAWFVGVGDGCIFGALWKGLSELSAVGWIRKIPALMGVQAEGAAPLAQAWEARANVVPWHATTTFADSIAVGHPRDWVKALRAARSSGGAIMAVPDTLISEAMTLMARHAGVLAEPAGAASVAGILAGVDCGRLGRSDRVVAMVTGHGLKDAASLRRTFVMPTPVPPTLEAVIAAAPHDEERSRG
ncbi:MAG: threonine synthase [Candidatus Eisenbacteria bacterium]|jgi:threonine synthase|nr:threonine synthase [Candidatus Eisenbacteria bacterium]